MRFISICRAYGLRFPFVDRHIPVIEGICPPSMWVFLSTCNGSGSYSTIRADDLACGLEAPNSDHMPCGAHVFSSRTSTYCFIQKSRQLRAQPFYVNSFFFFFCPFGALGQGFIQDVYDRASLIVMRDLGWTFTGGTI